MTGTKLRTRLIFGVAFVALLQNVGVSTRAHSPAVDLTSEARILDTFVTDLGSFDQKTAELGKKAALTRVEFDSQQRSADELKGRLSSVQNTLRQIITKLKAAGEWDGLDEAVLARVRDAKFQQFVRTDGFKKLLEELATGLSNNASEIGSPLDGLRSKVRAQVQGPSFEPAQPASASRVVRVAYTAAPAAFKAPVRCGLARVRLGIANVFSGPNASAPRASLAVGCYCFDEANACALIGQPVR